MALTKVVDGLVVTMTADEETAFLASQSGPEPVEMATQAEKLVEALVAENIIPRGKKAAILARVKA